MQDVGINFFTGGDHLFWHRGFEDEVDELPIIRPANYPEQMPAKGFEIVDVGSKGKVLVINVMGQTFVSETLNNPFKAVDEILDSVDEDISAVVVDFHAEATSDKHAMGFYLDGRVDLVVGTHTHVPTCDERVFPKGTMFVSDVGMSGNVDSVLGVESHIIVDRMVNGKKAKFEWEEKGRTAFRSILADTEKKEIIRVDKNLW